MEYHNTIKISRQPIVPFRFYVTLNFLDFIEKISTSLQTQVSSLSISIFMF